MNLQSLYYAPKQYLFNLLDHIVSENVPMIIVHQLGFHYFSLFTHLTEIVVLIIIVRMKGLLSCNATVLVRSIHLSCSQNEFACSTIGSTLNS